MTPLHLFYYQSQDVIKQRHSLTVDLTVKKPPTCFLVPVLLVHLGPVEVPSGQNSPVPLVSDPQAGLQPQVRLHPGSRSLALALFSEKLEQTRPTSITKYRRRRRCQQASGLLADVAISHRILFFLLSDLTKFPWMNPRICPLQVTVPASGSRRRHRPTASQRWFIPKHVFFRGRSLPGDTCCICILNCWLADWFIPWDWQIRSDYLFVANECLADECFHRKINELGLA